MGLFLSMISNPKKIKMKHLCLFSLLFTINLIAQTDSANSNVIQPRRFMF